jgi:Tol biopolymer transport system component
MSPLNLKTSTKKFLTAGIFSIALLGTLNGCYKPSGADQIAAVNLSKSEIKITEKIPLRVLVSNPWGHQMEYRYTADRGQVIANNGTNATALYYAPFTGGPDTIRVSIFDRTDNINLPVITNQTFIQGESMAYVGLPNTATPLNEADNGLIQVTSVRGSIQKKDIGWGRSPTISPDGRYIAYVTYPGDGSSQIIVKDPVGNESNITNNKSFNIDPSWSPIGTDGNLYLVFSSDRISSNSGNTSLGSSITGHGERYHLWRTHVNGYDLKQITNTAGNDFQPNWSPDGKSIVFSSDLDNNKSNTFRNIWVLDVQSGKQIQYTHETATNKGAYNPTWSPDAQKIVYSRKYQFRQLQTLADMQKIWMINFGLNSEGFGQIVTQAFDEAIVETFPSWAPDGRSISYVRARGTENAVVSVELSTISNIKGTFAQPTQEGDINNVTEANWARQRSYGYGYGTNPGLNNPFNPTNPTYPYPSATPYR